MTKAYRDAIENLKVKQTAAERVSFTSMRLAIAGDQMTDWEKQDLRNKRAMFGMQIRRD